MGTMIQRLELDEAGVRGERFADHHKDLKNFSDILCLTHPEKITDIHRGLFRGGQRHRRNEFFRGLASRNGRIRSAA